MRKLNSLLVIGTIGVLAALAGCGGGGRSSGGDGRVDVLLTDAPLVGVPGPNGVRTFSELNIDITAFEASIPGTRSFTSIPFSNIGATVTSVNLLDLNNDQEWLAVASLPTGDYDEFRLAVDPASANLVEQGTGTVEPLTLANPNGQLTIHMRPPFHVETGAAHLLLIDWRADRSVRYDAANNRYVLSGDFVATAINRRAAPIPFRGLPGRLTSVNVQSGDMRLRVERHSAAEYLVRTNINATTPTPAALIDEQGNTLSIHDFHAGDFVIVSGTVDGNTDVDASRVRRLPSPQNQPPGRPGPGHSNGGSNGNGPAPNPGVVFAHGVIHQLNANAHTFTLDTSFHGPVTVTYDPVHTEFVDGRVRPPQHANANILADNEAADVVGMYVPPAAQGLPPTIDATHTNGPSPTHGPGGIMILR